MNKTSLTLVVALTLFALTSPMMAQSTFDITVYHGINGKSLGLSKDLPVQAEIYFNGSNSPTVIDLSFKETFAASLPAGTSEIKVKSVELNDYITTMAIPPTNIPAGADVFLKAKKSGEKTPILKASIN